MYYASLSCFFFQAEDGIRDSSVTGVQTCALPISAKATIRISIEWQEVHDPEFALQGDDVYREPLAKLGLAVFRQRDPAGAQLPADDFEWIARAQRLPLRSVSRPGSAGYGQVLEVSLPPAGPST